jgi:hypothetical protein
VKKAINKPGKRPSGGHQGGHHFGFPELSEAEIRLYAKHGDR